MKTSDHVKVVLAHKRVAGQSDLTRENMQNITHRDSRPYPKHTHVGSVVSSRWGGSSVSQSRVTNRVQSIHWGLAQIESEYPGTAHTGERKTADAEIAALKNKVSELEARLEFVAKNSAVNSVTGDIVSDLKAQNIELRIAVKKAEKAAEEIPELRSRAELAEKKVSFLEKSLKSLETDLQLVRAESDCQQFLYERLGLIAKDFLVALRVAVSKLHPDSFKESNSVWTDKLDTQLGDLDLNRAVMEVYKLGMGLIGILNREDEGIMLDTETMGILYAAVNWESGGSIDPLMKFMDGTHGADVDVSEGPGSVLDRTPVSNGRRQSIGSVHSQFGSPASPWVSPMKGNVSGKALRDAQILIKSCTELLLGRETSNPLQPSSTMKVIPADPFEIDPAEAPEVISFIEELNRFKSAVLTVVSKLEIPEGAGSLAEYVEGIKVVTQEAVKEVRGWYDQLTQAGVDIGQIESVQRTISDLRAQNMSVQRELELARESVSALARESELANDQRDVAEAGKKDAELRLISLLDENARLKSGLTQTLVEQIHIRGAFFDGIDIKAAALRMRQNGCRHDLLENRHLYELPTGFQSVRRESAVEMLSMFEAASGFFDGTTPIGLSPTNFVISAFYGAPLPSSGGGYVRPAVVRTALESLRNSSTEKYSIHDLIGLFTESRTVSVGALTIDIACPQEQNIVVRQSHALAGSRTPKREVQRPFSSPKIVGKK